MTEKTISQLSRLLHKIAAKFPFTDEPSVMTDIHVRVNQETGDVMAYDDSDEELTRIVVDEWIDNNEGIEAFYQNVASELRKLLYSKDSEGNEMGSRLGLIMPYNYVLENELGDNVEELYVADTDNDTIVADFSLMEHLTDDLDDFINSLLKED